MKRLISIFIVTLLLFTACSGVSQAEYDKVVSERDALLAQNNSSNNSDEKLSISMEEIMPESTKEEKIEETVIPESEPESKEEAILESEGIWVVKYYVDEFKQPTKDAYITNNIKFDGVFSNSATNNSNLYATILVDKEDMAILLYEYGRSQVKNSSSRNSDYYDITIRIDDDKRINLTGIMYFDSDRIFIDSNYRTSVIDALSGEGDVAFYIVESDRTTNNYLFIAPSSNFSDVYRSLE